MKNHLPEDHQIISLFAQYSENYMNSTAIQKECTIDYLYSSVSRYFQDIAELMTEWYSMQKGSISEFLEQENLSKYINENQFLEISRGRAYFPSYFLFLLHKKQPFNIKIENLQRLNTNSKRKGGQEIFIDRKSVIEELKQYYKEKHNLQRQRIHEHYVANIEEERAKKRILNAKYRENNREEINQRNREAYHQNIEKMRKKSAEYHQKNREKINERRRESYHQNIEKVHEKAAQYRATHREELCQKSRARYHEDIEKTKAKRAEYYRKNSDRINEQRREYYEATKEKQHQYSAKYRETHREKIRARNRERNKSPTEEQLKRNAEKSRRYRERHKEKLEAQRKDPQYIAKRREVCKRHYEKKKRQKAIERFQTQTAPVIMSLLEALQNRR